MLIGLNGKKQAGKDTVHERIAKLYGDALPVERVSFADLLYESAAAALGVTPGFLREWKSDEGEAGIRLYDGRGQVYCDFTFRQYLQWYGTEAHREVFGDNFWVEQARAKLADHDGKIVVVTDVRFPNEAEAVFNAGGRVVTVRGPFEVEAADDGHASEAPLPSCQVDHVLMNVRRGDKFLALDTGIRALMETLVREERHGRGCIEPVTRAGA
jgi:hypothetical protein